MASVFVQDVEEFAGLRDQLEACPGVEGRRLRAHFEYRFDDEVVVERKAAGLRHALWYSCVAGLSDARIAQHDKNRLRVVATSSGD